MTATRPRDLSIRTGVLAALVCQAFYPKAGTDFGEQIVLKPDNIYGMDPGQFQRISKALADPRRMAILEAIAAGNEVACSKLCEMFPVSQATMSHHLKELVNAGLVSERRQAKFVFYRLQTGAWSQYLAEMRRRIPAQARRKT